MSERERERADSKEGRRTMMQIEKLSATHRPPPAASGAPLALSEWKPPPPPPRPLNAGWPPPPPLPPPPPPIGRGREEEGGEKRKRKRRTRTRTKKELGKIDLCSLLSCFFFFFRGGGGEGGISLRAFR